MPTDKFDAAKIRESQKPVIRRREMARRLGVSETYLRQLEAGYIKWTEDYRTRFMREIELWKKNPDLKPRKVWGRRHGHRADGTPVPRLQLAHA